MLKSQRMVPTLSQKNPLHKLRSCLFKLQVNIIISPTPISYRKDTSKSIKRSSSERTNSMSKQTRNLQTSTNVFHLQNSQLLVCILSQVNALRVLKSYFFKAHFSIILLSAQRSYQQYAQHLMLQIF